MTRSNIACHCIKSAMTFKKKIFSKSSLEETGNLVTRIN